MDVETPHEGQTVPKDASHSMGRRSKARKSWDTSLEAARAVKARRVEGKEDRARALLGAHTRGREAPVDLPLPADDELPVRDNHVLSQDMVNLCLRLVSLLHSENKAGPTVSTAGAAERCAQYTGVSVSQIRQLWADWHAVERRALPVSLLGAGRIGKVSELAREFFAPLRAEVRRMRIENGRAVEVPMLQKWLLDKHHLVIERQPLTHALHGMGFVFGKLHKLQVRVGGLHCQSPTKNIYIYLLSAPLSDSAREPRHNPQATDVSRAPHELGCCHCSQGG